MGSTEICQPLTEQENAKVFSTFIMCSTEYAEIKKLAKPLIDRFEGKAVDLMCIGVGTGFQENDFIQNLGLNVNNFLAIEHQVKEGPSHLDVTDFIKQNSSPTRDDVVTFFLQTDYLCK